MTPVLLIYPIFKPDPGPSAGPSNTVFRSPRKSALRASSERSARRLDSLLVVRPHPEDLYRSRFWQDLIDEPVLDVDSSRAGAREIANELLVARLLLPGIRSENLDEFLGLFAQAAGRKFPGVFLRLPGEDDLPGPRFAYQPGRFDVLEIGVRIPCRIDSRIPGIERR